MAEKEVFHERPADQQGFAFKGHCATCSHLMHKPGHCGRCNCGADEVDAYRFSGRRRIPHPDLDYHGCMDPNSREGQGD